MKRFALLALALAIMMLSAAATTLPAGAQSDGVPVKNALVVLTGQDEQVLQAMLEAGGSPSSIRQALEAAKELLLSSSASAPYAPTDSSGRFEIDAPVNPGTYDVSVFAPGFVASDAASSIAIDDTGIAKNMTIFVQQSAVVSGRLTDEQGNPVSGIVVAAGSPHSPNYDITMDDGVFVLDTSLKTGSHEIYAFKPGIDVARLNLGLPLENRVPPLFREQDGGYIPHASTVQLEQGKLTTLNIQLAGSHEITGRVTDGSGNAVAGAAVFAFDATGAMADVAGMTDVDGRYMLDNGLAAGTYTLVIPSLFSKGFGPASATVNLPGENIADFSLQNSSSIAGRVTDANGSPVAGATVLAISKNANSTQLGQFLAAGMAQATTDSEGRFVLDAGIGEGMYIVTTSFGNVPVSSSVEVRAGGTANIALGFSETVAVKGKVVDSSSGAPVENALVIPGFASGIPSAELFAARTGPDGMFTLAVPINDAETKSLFREIIVSADSYKSATTAAAAQNNNTTVRLEKAPAAKITGIVIAQKSLSPPVEIALTRAGTVLIGYEGTQYGVGLRTNSRVLDASFDQPNKRVSIALEGVQGSAGRSEFAIPKEFLAGPFAVSLDGRIAEPESIRTSENQTHTTIAFDHEHGVQEVTIQGTTAVPEFPLPAVLAASGLAGAILYRRFRP